MMMPRQLQEDRTRRLCLQCHRSQGWWQPLRAKDQGFRVNSAARFGQIVPPGFNFEFRVFGWSTSVMFKTANTGIDLRHLKRHRRIRHPSSRDAWINQERPSLSAESGMLRWNS